MQTYLLISFIYHKKAYKIHLTQRRQQAELSRIFCPKVKDPWTWEDATHYFTVRSSIALLLRKYVLYLNIGYVTYLLQISCAVVKTQFDSVEASNGRKATFLINSANVTLSYEFSLHSIWSRSHCKFVPV